MEIYFAIYADKIYVLEILNENLADRTVYHEEGKYVIRKKKIKLFPEVNGEGDSLSRSYVDNGEIQVLNRNKKEYTLNIIPALQLNHHLQKGKITMVLHSYECFRPNSFDGEFMKDKGNAGVEFYIYEPDSSYSLRAWNKSLDERDGYYNEGGKFIWQKNIIKLFPGNDCVQSYAENNEIQVVRKTRKGYKLKIAQYHYLTNPYLQGKKSIIIKVDKGYTRRCFR